MMNKILRIDINGFKKLNDIGLFVRPFMVLIGANGVGKTSMLDAFSLLSSSASGVLNRALSELGGLSNLLTRGKTEAISFSISMEIGKKNLLNMNFD
jgi:predicted ATPase